jgi:hypothetical protein
MEKFVDFIEDLYERELPITINGKGCQIDTKVRNALKQEICDNLYDIFKEYGLQIHKTSEGLVLAIPNLSCEEENEEGVFSIAFKMAVKNLDYCPEFEEEDFLSKIEEKNAKKEQKLIEKRLKIERDKQKREALKNLN